MAAQTQKVETDQALTLADRRAFMKLPLEERRRRLAEQADRMVDHYKLEPERTEREAWQGGDIIDPQLRHHSRDGRLEVQLEGLPEAGEPAQASSSTINACRWLRWKAAASRARGGRRRDRCPRPQADHDDPR